MESKSQEFTRKAAEIQKSAWKKTRKTLWGIITAITFIFVCLVGKSLHFFIFIVYKFF